MTRQELRQIIIDAIRGKAIPLKELRDGKIKDMDENYYLTPEHRADLILNAAAVYFSRKEE